MQAYEMIKMKNWAVIGSVNNPEKYAHRILKKFKNHGYTVAGVNPRGGEEIFKTLKEVPFNIDAIDLCINSKLGLEYMKEAKELGIRYVLIQPGARSSEIMEFCRENGIEAINGCALVELG